MRSSVQMVGRKSHDMEMSYYKDNKNRDLNRYFLARLPALFFIPWIFYSPFPTLPLHP